MGIAIDLSDQVALVTGGATNIGAEVCRKFAEAGAAVVINYFPCERDENAAAELIGEITAKGGKVMGCAADVSDEMAVKDMMQKVIHAYGRIDMLVNNAMISPKASCTELSFEDYMRTLKVNAGGAFLVSRECIPHMLKQGAGSVIMVTSSAFVNGGGGSCAYPSSKGAMEGLMRGLVNEYARHNLRFNTVRPAVVDTPNNRGRYTEQEWLNYIGKMPMRRAGTVTENANMIVVLSDKNLSGFINGTCLDVDGARVHHLRP